jgi:hypothetical protein
MKGNPLQPHTPNCTYSPHKRAKISQGYQLGLSDLALSVKEGVNDKSVFSLVLHYKQQI